MFEYQWLRGGATMGSTLGISQAIFPALADRTRVRVMRLLVEGGAEMCLCDLSDSLQEPAYKLSRHLKLLRGIGLLRAKKEGRWIYHRIVNQDRSFDLIYKIIRQLPDDEGKFSKDLTRFRRRAKMAPGTRCRPIHPTKARTNATPRIML